MDTAGKRLERMKTRESHKHLALSSHALRGGLEGQPSIEVLLKDFIRARYAALPAGAAKEQALLELCRCFHPYLMKYLAMICHGKVPLWQGQVNQDTKNFIRYFLPKGARLDSAGIGKAIRHLHLAFKTMKVEEIYDVLMEQFLRAAAKYDPQYSVKLKQVVEVIQNALSGFPSFRAADVDQHLESGSHRYLRLLCRRGFLISEKEPGAHAVYRRTATWPPPAGFFDNGAIGFAYYLQTGLAALPA